MPLAIRLESGASDQSGFDSVEVPSFGLISINLA